MYDFIYYNLIKCYPTGITPYLSLRCFMLVSCWFHSLDVTRKVSFARCHWSTEVTWPRVSLGPELALTNRAHKRSNNCRTVTQLAPSNRQLRPPMSAVYGSGGRHQDAVKVDIFNWVINTDLFNWVIYTDLFNWVIYTSYI